MLIVTDEVLRKNNNSLHEMQKLVVLAEMNRQKVFFKVHRVGDYFIEAIQRRFFPETGIHFNKMYQGFEGYVWRELPSDRPEE